MNPMRKRLTLVKPTTIGGRSDKDLSAARSEEATGARTTEPAVPPIAVGRSQQVACQPEGYSGTIRTIRTTDNRLGEASRPVDALTEVPTSPTVGGCGHRPYEKAGRITVDFGNGSIVKGLATKLKREVRSWGDTISHYDALTIVARMFGHDGYEEFHSRLGMADLSEPDCAVGTEEAARRYRQYVTVLTENDFSIAEAKHLLDIIRVGAWWSFSGDRTPAKPRGTRIRVAEVEVEFLDLDTANRLFRVFKRALRTHGLAVEEGARHLFATMFGHTTFNRLLKAAGLGNPSIPDFLLAPEAFDERVRGYLEVFSDAGIGDDVAVSLLREGFGGWFGIEENEWESLRQPRHVDQIENGPRPRWRPRRLRDSTG